MEIRPGIGLNHTINKNKIVLYKKSVILDNLIHELSHVITNEYGHTKNFYINLAIIKGK